MYVMSFSVIFLFVSVKPCSQNRNWLTEIIYSKFIDLPSCSGCIWHHNIPHVVNIFTESVWRFGQHFVSNSFFTRHNSRSEFDHHHSPELFVRLFGGLSDEYGVSTHTNGIRRKFDAENLPFPIRQLLQFDILHCLSEREVCRLSGEIQSDFWISTGGMWSGWLFNGIVHTIGYHNGGKASVERYHGDAGSISVQNIQYDTQQNVQD